MPIVEVPNLKGGVDRRIDARPIPAKTATDWQNQNGGSLTPSYPQFTGLSRPLGVKPAPLSKLVPGIVDTDTSSAKSYDDPAAARRRNLILGGLSGGQADIAMQQSATPSSNIASNAAPIPGAPRASAATFEGLTADEFFGNAAQRQKQSNAYAEYKPTSTNQTASSPLQPRGAPVSATRSSTATTNLSRPMRTPLGSVLKLPTMAQAAKEVLPQPPLISSGLTPRQNWARNLQQKSQELTERSQRQRAAISALPGFGNLKVAESAMPTPTVRMETPLQSAGSTLVDTAKNIVTFGNAFEKGRNVGANSGARRKLEDLWSYLNTPRPVS